jgi:hypothetical protein
MEAIGLGDRPENCPASTILSNDALRAEVNKKTACESFQMYAELLDIFRVLQPEFFRSCIKILKAKKFPNFEIIPTTSIKELYPDFVPDVFLRLW